VTRTTHSTNGKIGELEIMPGGETAILDRRQFGRYRAALRLPMLRRLGSIPMARKRPR